MTLPSLRSEPILERSQDAELAFEVVHGRTEAALLALSRRQFKVACYRWIAGYSTAQTADLMHVSQGTVKATLYQARQNILVQVADLCVPGDEGLEPAD
jgi:DNA-directed RNA polymerase specialized sigma24 family protein